MAAIKLLLGIICFAFIGRNGLHNGYLLSRIAEANRNRETPQRAKQLRIMRAKLVSIAEREVGTREKTGNNDGTRIKQYLALLGLKIGEPYCAAFVCWVYGEAGLKKPRSGWSPDLFPGSRLARSALPGNVIGIYFKKYGRIAHVGLIVRQEGDWIISVEGNTNLAGSREGEGVYLKRRHIKTIHSIADWVIERREQK